MTLRWAGSHDSMRLRLLLAAVTTLGLGAGTPADLPLARPHVVRAAAPAAAPAAATVAPPAQEPPEPVVTGPPRPPEPAVEPAPLLTPLLTPLLAPRPVTVTVTGFLSWALLDRRTGTVTGSANAVSARADTMSMVKIWITADFLRRLGSVPPSPDRLDELSRMIRDSDNDAAEDVYELDGSDAVMRRMVSTCGLTETTSVDGWWSRTGVSARDAVRLGACVADGRAAGPQCTNWLLGQLRQVRGEVRFGIVDALPPDVAPTAAIKNGWLLDDAGNWHVDCLAVLDDAVLSVLTVYPGGLGLGYGAGLCRQVTAQLRTR